MPLDCNCRAYVDRLLAEKDSWIEAQLTALLTGGVSLPVPILQRLYGATKAVRPSPVMDAARGGIANTTLQDLLRRQERQ